MNKRKRWIFLLILASVLAFSIIAFATSRSASPYHKLSTFARVLTNIERYYVDRIDGEQLIEGAINGMLRTLDPHSSYLTWDDYKILKENTSGNFGGVGLEVGIKNDTMIVIAPISGSPAEAMGISPGDHIVKIEDRATKDLSMDESVKLMRGKIGTKVTITILRENRPEPFDVTLTRAIIHVESVITELLAPGFPRIWIRIFQNGTSNDVKNALDQLSNKEGGLQGIVLDMRNNPGGLLDEAVKVSDLFLKKGIIVTTRGRDKILLDKYKAHRRGTITKTPMVVLINGASASASEIVAGALQDHGRGVILGTQSFGKGSVQSIIPLDKGCGLKLTVALYATPSGKTIQALGIKPDIIVENGDSPLENIKTKGNSLMNDNQLQKALQILSDKSMTGSTAPIQN